MQLEIINPDDALTIEFGQWLIKQLQSEIAASIDPAKLTKWDLYFAKAEEYKSIYNKPVTTKSIILAGLKSFVCNVIPGKIIIRCNSTTFVPGMNCVNLEATCRLINYGTAELTGYPIFSEALARVAENINDYISMYLEGW